MEITLLQENLESSLNYIQKAVPSKAQLPILSSILITAENGICQVGATDLYFGVRATVQAQITKEGTVAVPGREFREIVGSLPAGEIILQYDSGTLTIKTAHTKSTLQCQESKEYPPFPQVSGEITTFPRQIFDTVAQVILYSASNDQARPLLTGVLFDLKETTIRTVTTDGFRLSIADFTTAVQQAPLQFILPVRAVSEVCRIATQLGTETITCTVSQELKQVYVALDTIEIYSRILEGDYPPYERIIPSIFTTEVTIASEELLEQVKRATIFSRDTSSIVQLVITGETISVQASSSTLGSYSGEIVSAKITGEGGSIAFKSKYILDFLQAAKQTDIWFGMSDSLKPALFQAKSLNGYRYIVMPFRVNT